MSDIIHKNKEDFLLSSLTQIMLWELIQSIYNLQYTHILIFFFSICYFFNGYVLRTATVEYVAHTQSIIVCSPKFAATYGSEIINVDSP